MAKENPYELNLDNTNNNDAIDIIDKLNELVCCLNIDEGCQMLLKPSTTDLQNEIKFDQRADQVFKHHRRHDQIMIENNIMNELQQSINIINNDLDKKLNKKELDSKNIIEIYDRLMTLKMLNLKYSINTKSLKDFIKLNKINLEEVTKIENGIKVVQSLNEKPSKKSDIKIPHTVKDRRPSILCISNRSRRNNHDTNFRVQPRINIERIRQSENLTNENIIFDSQVNEVIRMRYENDHTDMVESLNNQPNINQNTRHRYNEESMSNDLMTSSMEEDLQLIESPDFNSSVNLCKDNEDNNSGDIYLLLQPHNSWMES
ncbi:uncharacterized protein LOC114130858 [Aphis gossypii]|uniref:uncharacterized protein LOC114130858 n=1 Tax=Aphis gossypii TaxID=80765 RepID=UPI002159873E|nr:uncharacterized protein LOC114130858 [Aphis gossypii]